jgi:hypothetical protein
VKLLRETMRRLVLAAVCAGVSVGLSGCLHKKAQAAVTLPPPAPVALAPPPTSDHLPMLDVPPVVTPPVPTAAAASKPKRERRRPAKAAPVTAPAPQVAAAEGLPEASAIGALTAGGDASPQRRQEAADLIAANDKRLKGLSTKTVADKRTEISKIVNFQRQAQEALDSGDAEGAKTLATKVHLLLVDIDPNGGN